jgi:hypothetical protein
MKKVTLFFRLAFLLGIATLRAQNLTPPDSISSTSFTRHLLTAENIQRLPFRGIQNYVPLLSGVVLQNSNFHIRGSRAGESAYFVDGVAVTNRFFNSEGISIIPEAIAQLEISTGAYGAEFGGANAGLIHTQMRTGGEHLQYALRLESDDFAKPGKEFFNTTAFGFRNLVGTIGGPLRFGAKFFLAGEHHYLRNRQIIFLEPFRFEGLVTDGFFGPQDQPLPGAIAFKRNYLPNNWNRQNTLQGNLLVPLHPKIDLRLTGSYSKDQAPEGGNWPYALENYFRQRRNMRNETTTKFGAIRATHELTSKLSYQAQLGYLDASGTASKLVVLRNDGAGTVKGAELGLYLRRTKRLEAQLYYTFSQALGTSSQPKSNAGEIGYYYP